VLRHAQGVVVCLALVTSFGDFLNSSDEEGGGREGGEGGNRGDRVAADRNPKMAQKPETRGSYDSYCLTESYTTVHHCAASANGIPVYSNTKTTPKVPPFFTRRVQNSVTWL
jgi:hypothetical protein